VSIQKINPEVCLAPAFRKIFKHIAAIMADPQPQPFFSAAFPLLVFSKFYKGIVRARQCLYGRGWLATYRLPCLVVAIGNIEVGGTGKTPMTIHLAGLLKDSGLRPVIISRGYRGKGDPAGGVVSDGRSICMDAQTGGDEPYLMASLLDNVPVVIGKDRFAAGWEAIRKFRPDVILLDDAFQHMRLQRDLNILLLDSGKPLGNGHLLPRGSLREPLRAAVRSDAIVLTRSGAQPPPYYEHLCRAVAPRPVFRAWHRAVFRGSAPAGASIGRMASLTPCDDHMAGKRLFAFSGLARNNTFIESLVILGAEPAGSMGFADHHKFSARDMKNIVAAAQQLNCRCLVTTDKDYVRLPIGTILGMDLIVVGVSIDFKDDAERWDRFIAQHVVRCQGHPVNRIN
jgi:tetraacyldisaccharide 4'-kinase